jgi:ATPase subunit of ABC transporter with duplicated ATPase domains
VLSARGLDTLLADLEKQQALMAEVVDEDARDKAVRRYGHLEERFSALGGYAAESEAGRICSSLGLPERVLTQPLRTLSGGQRRRVELARILFAASEGGAAGANDHDAAARRAHQPPRRRLDRLAARLPQSHTGGLVIISHDVELLADVVNRVWFLDAVRGEADVYNMGWQKYLDARATDEQRRRRERANAERKASALRTQAAKMGAKATKAVAAQNMLRRADRMMAALDEERGRQGRPHQVPDAGAVRQDPLVAKGLTKTYGSLEVFSGVDLAIDRGSRVVVLGLNGAGKTTLLRLLAGTEAADAGHLEPGTGSRSVISHRNTTPWTTTRPSGRTSGTPRPTPVNRTCGACSVRSCSAARSSTSRRARSPAARRPGWRWPGWSPRRRTCCCSTSPPTTSIPLPEQVLDALRSYVGAVVLVTHDRVPPRRSNRSGWCCCRTAPRTTGQRSIRASSSSPDNCDR